jgi:hypothetical protein
MVDESIKAEHETVQEVMVLALEEYERDGEVSTVLCHVCGSKIQIRPLNDHEWTSSCDCKKYSGTLRAE